MSEVPVERFSAFGEISDSEVDALQRLVGPAAALRAGADVGATWSSRHVAFFLHDGWAFSSVDLPDGGRQIFKLHLPGDIMGAPSLAFAAPVETLVMVTAGRVSPVSLPALGALFEQAPRLGAMLFLTAQEEHVILMDRLTAVARMDAERAMTSLLLHLHDRLARAGALRRPGVIPLPLTQPQIADVLGLTSVHVSRVLRRLERAGWIRRSERTVELVEPSRMRAAAALSSRTLRRDAAWLPARAGRSAAAQAFCPARASRAVSA